MACVEGDADDGDGPYGKEQHSAAVVCERDEAKRRIAAGYEQVDAAVVDEMCIRDSFKPRPRLGFLGIRLLTFFVVFAILHHLHGVRRLGAQGKVEQEVAGKP